MSMFAPLMKKLLGPRDAGELRRERLRAWAPWCLPLGETGAGRDPGYEDAFLAIRSEIDKLAGIDDAMIVASCERLLKETGKDVRLAGYYALARLRTDGTAGFVDGLELTAALVDAFGQALLPARSEARRVALEWLASTRIVDLLRAAGAPTPADLERALCALDVIVSGTASWPDAARPDLGALASRFAQTVQPPRASDEIASITSSRTPGASHGSVAVTSARDLLEQARAMARYLREQEHGYFPAARLIRCVRWDTVHETPPADRQGRTRLTPPRGELRQQLSRLVVQKHWHELLENVEGAFMEGANHLWLDLAYFQHLALEQVGSPYREWRELLHDDLAQMLGRLVGIDRLAFSDGTPCADEATLAWLDRHAAQKQSFETHTVLVAHDAVNDGASAWRETEAQAHGLLKAEGLDAALAWLGDLPRLYSARQRFAQRWLMARLAMQAGRHDVALALSEALVDDIDRHDLAQWEPDLAFEVTAHCVRALKEASNRKPVDRQALLLRSEKLQKVLTVLDPARALAMGA